MAPLQRRHDVAASREERACR